MATLYASTESIRREAAQLDPVKVFLTLLLVVPFVLGWTLRFAWVAFSLLWTGGVQGWRAATEQIDARQAAAKRPEGGG